MEIANFPEKIKEKAKSLVGLSEKREGTLSAESKAIKLTFIAGVSILVFLIITGVIIVKFIAPKTSLKIEISGMLPLSTFKFHEEESDALHALFTQEMLKRGFLASKSIYVSYSHKENHIREYLKSADEVFGIIKYALSRKKIYSLLKGPVAHKGFRRLT